MRYILDSEGYVKLCSKTEIACDNDTCTAYEGDVPEGYESIEEWVLNANINAYQVIDGQLVYDADKDAKLQEKWVLEDTEAKSKYYIDSKGSNSNGEWIKYIDGTMETRQRYKASFADVSEWGSMFAYSITNIKNYPQTFNELPTVSVTLSVDHINGWLCTNVETGQESTSRPCGYQFVRPTERTPENTYLNIIAKGRWK
jgi:hypothetical protein